MIEPHRPALLLAVVGDAPAARTLRELAGVMGWNVTSSIEKADAIVIASMGRATKTLWRRRLRQARTTSGWWRARTGFLRDG